MSFWHQLPRNLPTEFGIEVSELAKTLDEWERVQSQLKLFIEAMIGLGYTVYKTQDMSDFITRYKFRKK